MLFDEYQKASIIIMSYNVRLFFKFEDPFKQSSMAEIMIYLTIPIDILT